MPATLYGRSPIRKVLAYFSLAWGLGFAASGQACAAGKSEKEKIEALITHVEGLKKAVFIRNGKEYDCQSAARFLRQKWKAQEADVATAEQFIDRIASKSSTTGKPYLIRLPDKEAAPAGDYLRAELKRLNDEARFMRRNGEIRG